MKTHPCRQLVAVGLMVLLGSGCKGQKPGDGPHPTSKQSATASELRAALCSYVVRCQVVAMDQATCTAAMASRAAGFDSPEALFHAVETGRATMDVSQVRSCIDSLVALPCEDGLTPARAFSSCQLAFAGKVALGGACSSEGECARGARCARTDGASACAGVCTALTQGACADSRDCHGGKICQAGRCAPPVQAVAAGQRCSAEAGCRAGLSCDSGICRPRPALGQVCSPGLPCASADLACVPSGNKPATCQASPGANGPCTSAFACGGVLSAMVCDVDGSHTCVPRPKDGPCKAGQCDPFNAFCDGASGQATCRPFLAEGASCQTRGQCGTPFSGADCLDDGSGSLHCVGGIPTVCL
jgi:hypothetical protein